jgi:hypothetical protein
MHPRRTPSKCDKSIGGKSQPSTGSPDPFANMRKHIRLTEEPSVVLPIVAALQTSFRRNNGDFQS